MRRAPQHAAGLASLAVGKQDPKILQDFLALKFALSRRTAKAMIDGRNVWVDRKCVWIARYALKTGDIVEIPQTVVKGAQKQSAQTAAKDGRQPAAEGRAQPRDAAAKRHVRVLWQNEHYLVCDKPAGLVSCDDPKSVESILREQENIPTLEAVHRLDRDTTGCLMFAKRHAALEAAIEMFRTHKVSKVYHAIVAGPFKFAHRIVDTPLDGTNQIRRHLSSIRFPIIGDRVFGLKNARDPRLMRVPRQMLHASTLTLPDPLSPREKISVHSPLPADFRQTLRLFGMGAS